MADPLFHPEVETLEPRALRRHQERAWERQWEYVRARSGFYARKLDGRLPERISLDGLQELPLTDKEELRQSQELEPPFGDFVAGSEEQIVRLHRTSGTTGRALNLGNTRRDLDVIARVGARTLFASGLRPTDRAVHCMNYSLWIGGLTDHLSLEAVGAMVVPFGVGNTARLLETIVELRLNVLSCTPSYPALLEQVLREDGRWSPRDLGLRLALFAGEAGLDNPGFRSRLEDTWGFGARDADYGMADVLSSMGSQCERTTELHFAGDALFAEILDPASGGRLPLEEGTVGELVCTHLEMECQPLVRYRTRDMVTVTSTDPCECGRTSWRFRISGRTDEMFKVRGVMVFPSAVHGVVSSRPDLASGQFRIRLQGPGPYDRIELTAEAARDLDPAQWEGAARALADLIRARIGASALVTLVPFESLPRTALKTGWLDRVPA